jgi:hypothetical protein
MAEPRDRISAARSAHWPLGRHGGSQWAGWALWPGPYGRVGDQDGCVYLRPLAHGLNALAYSPRLYVYIHLANSDT